VERAAARVEGANVTRAHRRLGPSNERRHTVRSAQVSCYAVRMRETNRTTTRRSVRALSASTALIAAAAAMAQVEIGPRPGVQVFVAPPQMPAATLPSDADLARIDVAPELLRLARTLDQENYAERAAARDAILTRKPSPNELMALLLRRDLGIEARHALVSILRDRILKAPRGALGIRMETLVMGGDGVRITGVVAGMPAADVLQAGDIVTSVNGVTLKDRNDLIRQVQSLEPGDEVAVVVRRAKRDEAGKPIVGADGAEVTQQLDLKLRLGSTDDLVEKGDPVNPLVFNPMTLERAATAQAAADRFLPRPRMVPIQRGLPGAAPEGPVTIDSLRSLLVEFQLKGGDPDLVRQFRARLDAIERQMDATLSSPNRTDADLARLEQAVESTLKGLEAEIREAQN